MRMNALKSPALQIAIAAVAGLMFGLVVGEWAANLKFVGDMFIRLIQMSIVLNKMLPFWSSPSQLILTRKTPRFPEGLESS